MKSMVKPINARDFIDSPAHKTRSDVADFLLCFLLAATASRSFLVPSSPSSSCRRTLLALTRRPTKATSSFSALDPGLGLGGSAGEWHRRSGLKERAVLAVYFGAKQANVGPK